MRLKINGVLVEDSVAPVLCPLELTYMENEIQKHVKKFGKIMLPASIITGALNVAKGALAAGTAVAASGSVGTNLADALMPLIHMVQDFAFPVGIVVASWGLIEVMVGQPNGKTKIKMSVVGFIGMYIIPTIFKAIRAGFAGI